ncbi:MAG: toprim domain-containing protein [Elusimicrobiota bacterium]
MGRPKSLDTLAQSLRLAFGHVGPRQSQRMAIRLVSLEDRHFMALTQAMQEARRRVGRCELCQDFTEAQRCRICADSQRDIGLLCITENSQDVEALEASRSYNGLYHVLHGSLEQGEDRELLESARRLTIEELWARLGLSPAPREVILALDQDMAGELTSLYLAREIFRRFGHLKISRIGVGIPFGGEVLYADPATVKHSLRSRIEMPAPQEAINSK